MTRKQRFKKLSVYVNPFRRQGKRSRGLAKTLSIPAILIVAVLVLAFWPRHKIYTLNIITEIASLEITDPLISEWDISGADIYLDPLNEKTVHGLEPYSTLRLAGCSSTSGCVKAEIQRYGVGLARIKLETDGSSVGTILFANGETRTLGSWATILLPIGDRPRIFPFRGLLTLGDDVTTQVDSILLEGSVSIIEEKLLSRGHYTAGEESLSPGDRIRLLHRNDKPAKLDGFIRMEPETFSEAANAMHLIGHGSADFARVDRFGTAGFEVRTQPWARFVNDPVLGALFAVLATFALLLEVYFKIAEVKKLAFSSKDQEPQ